MTEMHPYHIWESMLYDVLRTLPHMVLVLYAFRGHWRFGKKTTLLMTFLVWVIQMTLPQISENVPNTNNTAIDIIEIVVYLIFIFVMLKEHIGKLVFTVLALSNMGNIMLYCGKCIEGLLFPEQAQLRLHYTYTLCSLPVLILELTFAYFLIFRNICTHDDTSNDPAYREKIEGYLWHYLWLVPAVFSLIWFQSLYGSEKSTLEDRLNPLNSLYLLAVTAGSMLIYRIIVQLTSLYGKNIRLLAENHSLSIQRLQYDSLNERLENMRRTRHDLRHHAALLKEIRDSGDITALDDLISMYTEQNLLDQPLIRCENETVNVILALYSETACQNDIAFTVKAEIPEDMFADKKDLAVLFGNVLENAADACKEVESGRFIDLSSAYTRMQSGKHCLSLIVKNSFGAVSRDDKGEFHSTKHPGDGIGISSVKRITEKYGGSCSFVPEDGVFTVSVILYG